MTRPVGFLSNPDTAVFLPFPKVYNISKDEILTQVREALEGLLSIRGFQHPLPIFDLPPDFEPTKVKPGQYVWLVEVKSF